MRKLTQTKPYLFLVIGIRAMKEKNQVFMKDNKKKDLFWLSHKPFRESNT